MPSPAAMPRLAAIAAALATAALAGCTAAQQQTAQTDISAAAATGQLYCAKATAAGPLVVAIANAASAGAPALSVIGQTAAWVQEACAAWDAAATAVTPPASPVPTVAVLPPA